jgi:hypothetical protein
VRLALAGRLPTAGASIWHPRLSVSRRISRENLTDNTEGIPAFTGVDGHLGVSGGLFTAGC